MSNSLEMRQSEVDWIGEVPSTWGISRLKDVSLITAGIPAPHPDNLSKDEGLPFLRVSDLSSARDGWCSTSSDYIPELFRKAAKRWKPGTVVFPKSGESIRTNFRARIAVEMSVVSHLACLRAWRHVNSDYLFWLLNAIRFDAYILQTALPALGLGTIGGVQIPLPSKQEQCLITSWIDIQTHRIDKRIALLGLKRDLLGALKKSVIEESTFRGINPSAPQHESGIDWLGSVPSHWQTVRMGSLFQEAADVGREGLPMLTVSIHSGISDKELADDEMERKVSRSEDKTVYKRVKPGDLVYNQMRAWQGAFGAAQIEGLVSPAYVVARPKRGIAPKFVEYLLRAPAATEEIRRRSRGITDFRLRLYWDEFKNIRIALPPLDEQQAIADFLDRKLTLIDKQIALIDRLEALLKEQRKALIHEAVTGKIDLSNYEPPAQAA